MFLKSVSNVSYRPAYSPIQVRSFATRRYKTFDLSWISKDSKFSLKERKITQTYQNDKAAFEESIVKKQITFQGKHLRMSATTVFDSIKVFPKTYKQMTTKPTPLGTLIYENPNKDKIMKEVKASLDEKKHKGMFGYHCTTGEAADQMLAQAQADGMLEFRVNEHGEGLYVGSAEVAAHFASTRNGLIFHIATTCNYGMNGDFGTNTTFLSGNGKIYVLGVYKMNPEYHNYRKPWIWEIVSQWFSDHFGSK